MSKLVKKLLIVWIAAAMVLLPMSSAFSQPRCYEKKATAEEMAADFLLARPLGFASLVLGSVVFVFSLPFSAAGGNADEAAEKLVQKPAEYTFKRPLGDF
ncbi:MAG: hypothetical protein R6U50_10275 [Desulfobacterales bacterium]